MSRACAFCMRRSVRQWHAWYKTHAMLACMLHLLVCMHANVFPFLTHMRARAYTAGLLHALLHVTHLGGSSLVRPIAWMRGVDSASMAAGIHWGWQLCHRGHAAFV